MSVNTASRAHYLHTLADELKSGYQTGCQQGREKVRFHGVQLAVFDHRAGRSDNLSFLQLPNPESTSLVSMEYLHPIAAIGQW